MKKLLFIAMLAATNVQAQQYRKFLVAVQLGLPNSHGFISSFTLEPGYRLSDKMQIGFRMETQNMMPYTGSNSMPVSSMGLNAHYYLYKHAFVGAGVGLFNPSNNFIMNSTENQNQRNGVGLYPRLGYDLGHFRLMVEYNFVQPMKDYISYPMPGYVGHFENVNKSYLSLKVGFFIGGGRK